MDKTIQTTVWISGATSGIGEAVAKIFAAHDYSLILCGRRQERLQALQKELEEENICVKTLCFDTQKPEEVEAAFQSLPTRWQAVDVLINNAGLAAGFEPVHEGHIEDWEQMIDTNLKGLLYVSKTIIPKMIERKSGQIIHVSSIAGKEAYPNGAVYCASKHAVEAVAKAMRVELLPYGIKVGSIAPGMVETEFSQVRFHGDQQKAKEVYKGLLPLTAEDIAEAVWFMANRPPHVNIADLTIFPTAQGSVRDSFRK